MPKVRVLRGDVTLGQSGGPDPATWALREERLSWAYSERGAEKRVGSERMHSAGSAGGGRGHEPRSIGKV